MASDGHPSEQELNPGPEVAPRPAASVILLRNATESDDHGLEVLLVRRSPESRFVPGAWVFPGGAVRDTEGPDDEQAHRRAAVRELAEEASIELADPSALVAFSRWITPAEMKVRFDTRFYLAVAPPDSTPEPDGSETVDAGWFTPTGALQRSHEGQMTLVFPTIKHLEALAEFHTTEEALATARNRRVEPVRPRIVTAQNSVRILLPGDSGYDG